MAVTHTAALLLRSHPYGETSRVLRFLTRDQGIVGVMARGVRSAKGSGLDIFAHGRLTFYHKETRDLQTFKEFGVERARRGLGRHPVRLAAASVLADLVLRHGGDAEAPALFDALDSALDALADTDPEAVPGVLLRDGWGLIAVLGYHPSLDLCPVCGRRLGDDDVGRFDFAQGGVRCPSCAEDSGGPRLGPGARAQLAAFLSGVVPPDLRRPRGHLRFLSDFVTYHLAGSRGLESFRVLEAFLPPTRTDVKGAILGTAGHIDHGKTALVGALTGVDTDRLKEEKERGITIDLGFAELPGDDVRLGVVDVPGHEGFVRNMLAGATGMDLALLVVAADEGVMPQTREHLAILSLLGVTRLVVAVTKIDLVEEAWLELVEDEVREALAVAGFDDAVPFERVSAKTGAGIDALRARLLAVAAMSTGGAAADLFALPVDRVFVVRGTGTVVTGTLLSGRVSVGDRVRLLPSGTQARVRGLQVHGAEVESAEPGTRTAVALTGDGIGRDTVDRGEVLVSDAGWEPAHMITVRIRVLTDTGWTVRHNQRVRVHLGTAEVMARCVLFGTDELQSGQSGWAQLRLEAPVATRARTSGVVRSYSPVTTIAGIRVVEPAAPKRGRGSDPGALGFTDVLDGDATAATAAVVAAAGPAGVAVDTLPVRTGWPPARVSAALDALRAEGGVATPGGWALSAEVMGAVMGDLIETVDRVHRDEPWRPGVPVEVLRARAPAEAADGLVDAALERAVAEGALEAAAGTVRRAGFEVVLDEARTRLRDELVARFDEAGLTPPFLDELAAELRKDPAFQVILDGLVDEGRLVVLDHELYLSADAARSAEAAVRSSLGGREGLGPADFRDALPVTRRHLLPILAWMDRRGITRRSGEGRAVVGPAPGSEGTGEPSGSRG